MQGSPSYAHPVLGIDPGTAVTGYGVVEVTRRGAERLVECGVIRTSPGTPLPGRIREIYEEITALVARHRPRAASVEAVFQGRNARSALTLGHARGAILLALSIAEVPIAEYAPAEIKKAVTGTGRATKDQVAFMVRHHLRLKEAPAPADAADGVAAALCHCIIGDRPR
jgi:crossover junction endodeoxyribonuclease RuvC